MHIGLVFFFINFLNLKKMKIRPKCNAPKNLFINKSSTRSYWLSYFTKPFLIDNFSFLSVRIFSDHAVAHVHATENTERDRKATQNHQHRNVQTGAQDAQRAHAIMIHVYQRVHDAIHAQKADQSQWVRVQNRAVKAVIHVRETATIKHMDNFTCVSRSC